MKLDATPAIDGVGPSWLQRKKLFKPSSVKALKKKQDRDLRRQLMSRPTELASAFMLLNPYHNKFLILTALERKDLHEILPQMDKNVLLNGLRLFPKKVLIQLLFKLPKKTLLKMILKFISLKRLLKLSSKAGLLKMLGDNRIAHPKLLMSLKMLDDAELKLLAKLILKEDFKDSPRKELLKILMGTSRGPFLQALKKMPKQALLKMAFYQANSQPDVLTALPSTNLEKLFEMMGKNAIVLMMSALEGHHLQNMLTYLPDFYLSYALSGMSDKQFTELMLGRFSSTIEKLAENNL